MRFRSTRSCDSMAVGRRRVHIGPVLLTTLAVISAGDVDGAWPALLIAGVDGAGPFVGDHATPQVALRPGTALSPARADYVPPLRPVPSESAARSRRLPLHPPD